MQRAADAGVMIATPWRSMLVGDRSMEGAAAVITIEKRLIALLAGRSELALNETVSFIVRSRSELLRYGFSSVLTGNGPVSISDSVRSRVLYRDTEYVKVSTGVNYSILFLLSSPFAAMRAPFLFLLFLLFFSFLFFLLRV